MSKEYLKFIEDLVLLSSTNDDSTQVIISILTKFSCFVEFDVVFSDHSSLEIYGNDFFNNLSKEEQVLSLKNSTLLKKEDQGEFLIISNGPINYSPEVKKAINFLSLSVIKIIKRKNYLDELNKYKNNFFKSQADAGIGTFRYDIINNKLSFSPALFKMIGYKEGDPVPSVEKHRKCIHPEDLDHYISTLSGAINEGKSYNFYFRCYNVSTNDLIYLQGIGDVIKDKNGKLLEIVSTAINHTNQKKIERELQEANNFFKLVFNSIEHNLSVRNEKLEYVFTNKAYDKTFEQEMKHLSEVINNNFVSSNDYLNSRSFMLKQMLINYQTNEPFKSSHHYQRKNRIYLVQDTIFRGGNNKKYIVSIITDITESKKYQKAIIDIEELKIYHKELAIKNAQLIELSDIKSKFVANISHEIRNPLGVIIGGIEILKQSPFIINEEDRDYIEIIEDASLRLFALIKNVLDLAKIESEKIAVHLSQFNLYNEITKIINSQKIIIKNNSTNIVLEYDSKQIPSLVIGDKDKISQILINLLDNAIKFTNEGEVVIKVELLNKDYDSLELIISVKDDGIGIEKDDQKKIFDSFIQVSSRNSERSKKYQGTGLGLAICDKLAKLMGGSIELESFPKKGSEFKLRLRLGIQNKITFSEDCFNYNSALRPINILLVEDCTNNQKIMSSLLKKFNMIVCICDNGQDAVLLLETQSFDIVLMDCNMPIMDGYQATVIINQMIANKKIKYVPIIAITAYEDSESKKKFLEAGVCNYITKPVDTSELLSKINELVF